MKMYGEVEVQIQTFLTPALVLGQWSASRPGSFMSGKTSPVPIGQEAVWGPEPVWTTWREDKSCPHRDLHSDPSDFQPVANGSNHNEEY
jgi:hypothetical protein